ncbi:MAG: hypothetical protein ACREFU_10740 [Acetobacteraceae bacterium]
MQPQEQREKRKTSIVRLASRSAMCDSGYWFATGDTGGEPERNRERTLAIMVPDTKGEIWIAARA